METGNRWSAQAEVVKRMTSIITRCDPDKKGVGLSFINHSGPPFYRLNEDQVERQMAAFPPRGQTQIGTNLERKVLKPFIYDLLDSGERLERPYLVFITTDGAPTQEAEETLKYAITQCSKRMQEKGYGPEGTRK
jgi:hypothetical protein